MNDEKCFYGKELQQKLIIKEDQVEEVAKAIGKVFAYATKSKFYKYIK